jgi:hypothetical protein
MMRADDAHAGSEPRPERRRGPTMTRLHRRLLCGLGALLVAAALAAPVRADEYDAERAGHPLRIVAYALHPVGVILDYLIFRPAHWIADRDGVREFFGHTED